MRDSEELYENEMSFGDYDEDDDDEDDDDQDEEQDDDYSEKGDTDDDELSDAGAAVANASPDVVEAHRNMLGEVMQHLADNGIDIDEIAEDAGIHSSDVDALGHDDLATLTHYVAQNHPEVLQTVADRFPAAQGLLGTLTGGDGGGIGGFIKKLF